MVEQLMAEIVEIKVEGESLTPVEIDLVLLMTDEQIKKKKWNNYPLHKRPYSKT